MMRPKHVETIAVYQEERVKVYGISEKVGLALAILRFPAARTEFWGRQIIDMAGSVKRFDLVTCQRGHNTTMEIHLLCGREDASRVCNAINTTLGNEQDSDFVLHQPVDVLFLFGPHFQDRFGIVTIAFNALCLNHIDILVCGCAGTSMYFVTLNGQAGKGAQILTDTFLIPTTRQAS